MQSLCIRLEELSQETLDSMVVYLRIGVKEFKVDIDDVL